MVRANARSKRLFFGGICIGCSGILFVILAAADRLVVGFLIAEILIVEAFGVAVAVAFERDLEILLEEGVQHYKKRAPMLM